MSGTDREESRMGHSRRHRLGALALATIAAALVTTAASAGPPFKETIHDEQTFVLDDYCDVSGLSVEIARVVDIRVHINPHGRDRLEYFLQHGTWTEALTNVANGKSLTSVARVIEKDMRVMENSDGTVTVLIQATGNATLYGTNGKAIARGPGQVRLELVFDESGAELSRRVVRESTGRSDDFCTAAVAALS